MADPIDVDRLPPTQYLVLEVLAARHRTGEQLWPFPSRVRPALVALEHLGLIQTMHGNVPHTLRARLTEPGLRAVISPTYVPPDQSCEAETWSWKYFSTEVVDGYWIRCTLTGPHDEHADTSNTGLTWRDQASTDTETNRPGGEA